MRKVIVLSFITLDGVMQALGAPTEDISAGFTYGGWTVPYFDEFLTEVMIKQMSESFDLLLGRKTFGVFASYWPNHQEEGVGINTPTNFVASHTKTEDKWNKIVSLNEDIVEQIKQIK